MGFWISKKILILLSTYACIYLVGSFHIKKKSKIHGWSMHWYTSIATTRLCIKDLSLKLACKFNSFQASSWLSLFPSTFIAHYFWHTHTKMGKLQFYPSVGLIIILTLYFEKYQSHVSFEYLYEYLYAKTPRTHSGGACVGISEIDGTWWCLILALNLGSLK